MSLRQGEEGKIIRVASSFDMSQNTDISLTFVDPNGATTVKSISTNETTLGTVAITDPILGVLNANEYADYPVEAGFAIKGNWSVFLTYTNANANPKQVYVGNTRTFQVD